MNLLNKLSPYNQYNTVLVRRSVPYSYKSYTTQPNCVNSQLDNLKRLVEGIFKKLNIYLYNSAVIFANKLKIYRLEKKPQFFAQTLTQSQLIASQVLGPFMLAYAKNNETLEQPFNILKNFDMTRYASMHTSLNFKKISKLIPKGTLTQFFFSYIRLYQPFQLIDIGMTAIETSLIIERSILGFNESRQLYKINKNVAIRSAIAHLATLFISLNKIHTTINDPQYISLYECSRLDENKLERLKDDYIKNHKKDLFCPERAYIKELNETCEEQAVQILNPQRRLEELTKINYRKDYRELMRSCHVDKNPDKNNSEEINAINAKINIARDTIDKYLEQATS